MEGTLAQPYVFMVTLYAGMALGAVYSVIAAVQRGCGKGRAVTIATDILFGLILTATAAAVFYYTVEMEIRFYCVAALFIGMALWLAAAAPLAKYVCCKFSRRRVDKRREKRSNNSRR